MQLFPPGHAPTSLMLGFIVLAAVLPLAQAQGLEQVRGDPTPHHHHPCKGPGNLYWPQHHSLRIVAGAPYSPLNAYMAGPVHSRMCPMSAACTVKSVASSCSTYLAS